MTNKLTSTDIFDINKKTGALILGKDRLDDYATKYLTKHYKRALETPMPLPVEEILQEEKLTVEEVSLSKNLDVFGCCFLLDGEVEVYNHEQGIYKTMSYPARTVLIDPDFVMYYGEGAKRNTLIHEALHWEKDKTYFEILAVKNAAASEKLYPIMCRQSETFYKPPDGKKTKENEVRWLEWQAHRLAPRVLMPKDMFVQKAKELLQEPIESCDDIVDKLASFFIVSRSSVVLRLIEVGMQSDLVDMPDYKDMFREQEQREHIAITAEEAFDLLTQNDILSKWIEENHMVFADGYFVVANKKFVTLKDGRLSLTKCAKNGLDTCTVNICEQHIVSRKIVEKEDCGGCAVLLNASGVDERLLLFHPKYQAGIHSYLKSEEERGKYSILSSVSDGDVYDSVVADLFEDDDDNIKKEFLRRLSDPYTSLCQCLWYWFENHNLRYPDAFWDATRLHKNYHNKIKNNKNNNMNKETLMAICVGLKFDLSLTQKVFEKARLILDEYSDPDKTYIKILARIPGLDIDEFNELLNRRGIKGLGTTSKE